MDIKEKLCKEMHQFVKLHIDEVENKLSSSSIKRVYDELGFKNRKDMLSQIKNDWEVAFWAMTELCAWSMNGNYGILFLCGEYDSYNAYGICKRYFKKPYHEDGIVEVKQVVKTVKVIDWEERL